MISHLKNKSGLCDLSKVKPKKIYTAIELFAGAGGLALGLENAGFDIKGVLEVDKYSCETLKINRPNWNVICDNIINIVKVGISKYISLDHELDLLSGGYPCQSFSQIGKRLGLDDVRGTMFYYYALLLNELKPKMFLVENVKGLLTHDYGKTLDVMLNMFFNIGYRIRWKILNANDYNVAQNRERLFIVGIRNDISPINLFEYPKPFAYKPVLNDILQDVPVSACLEYLPYKKYILGLIPEGGNWNSLPDDIIKSYLGEEYLYSRNKNSGKLRRMSRDKACATILCCPIGNIVERCHPTETRPFSVREYARIQSFPDNWTFSGSVYQQYKQIGNAVPVELAKAMGLAIINVLNEI